ncbi:hypothetical protein GOP47_0030105 [Adiantum capillus-veneris]|nr:hypothetical protein GOP47_0030105 [Adiantum capillus-veneris]
MLRQNAKLPVSIATDPVNSAAIVGGTALQKNLFVLDRTHVIPVVLTSTYDKSVLQGRLPKFFRFSIILFSSANLSLLFLVD